MACMTHEDYALDPPASGHHVGVDAKSERRGSVVIQRAAQPPEETHEGIESTSRRDARRADHLRV